MLTCTGVLGNIYQGVTHTKALQNQHQVSDRLTYIWELFPSPICNRLKEIVHKNKEKTLICRVDQVSTL